MNKQEVEELYKKLLKCLDEIEAEMKTWDKFGQAYYEDKGLNAIKKAYCEHRYLNIKFDFIHFDEARQDLEENYNKIIENLRYNYIGLRIIEEDLNTKSFFSMCSYFTYPRYILTDLTRWWKLIYKVGLDYDDTDRYIGVLCKDSNFRTDPIYINLENDIEDMQLDRFGDNFKSIAKSIEKMKNAENELIRKVLELNL